MSPLPAEFVGVWERVGLTVDGRDIVGAGRSFWFQSSSRFLDVRAAGGGLRTEAFGGYTTWRESTATLTWHHEFDLHPEAAGDSGAIDWHDGDLVEHGTAGLGDDMIRYTEIWRRRSAPDEPLTIADRVDGVGRLARCGDRGAVTIDDRRPNGHGSHRGGVFTDRGRALAFDLVLGASVDVSHQRWRVVEVSSDTYDRSPSTRSATTR